MALYTYTGIDPSGKEIHGQEAGASEEEVIGRLSSSGVSVLSIRAKRALSFNFDPSKYMQWVSNKELKYFYVNLATLIDAGCTLRASIASLADQADNPLLQSVLKDINAQIASGKSFSESLAQHPNVFTPLFVNLVKAGEEGGMLDQILLRYAVYTENQEAIKAKIRGALILPTLVLVVAILVVVALLTYVFPTFMQLFKGKEHLLPTPTRVVIAISDFLRYQYLVILGILFGGGIGIGLALRTDTGWRIFSWLQLHLPLFGRLFRKAFVARFAHTLAALVKGGVPALRALKITSETIPNVIVQDVIGTIQESVERGGSFTAPMHKQKYLFPAMVTLMIHVGETTGQLDSMLSKVGQYFDAEVDEAIDAIIKSIEPIMTVVMGSIVLTIAASMFLPLFNMTKIMR